MRTKWLTAALVGGLALAQSATGQETDTNPYTGDAEAIAEGQHLYMDTGCYACHGQNGEGAMGPDLRDDQWVYRPTDRTLFKAIAQGRPQTNMVAWDEELSEDEIWKVVAFIRSLYQGNPDKIIW